MAIFSSNLLLFNVILSIVLFFFIIILLRLIVLSGKLVIMMIIGRSNDDWILRTYYSGNLSGGYRFSYYQRSRLRLGCNFLVVERSCLHKFKQFGVRVWLELFEDEGVANDMKL